MAGEIITLEKALMRATKLKERQTSEENIVDYENYRRQLNTPRSRDQTRSFNL